MDNKRPILEEKIDGKGHFAAPKSFTAEDEIQWSKRKLNTVRLALYADEICGFPFTLDPMGSYLCGGRADGSSLACNKLEGKECLILTTEITRPHNSSCAAWERQRAGDPEGRECPKGKFDAKRIGFGTTKNPLGFGCIRCEYGQTFLQRPDSNNQKRWCEEKGHPVGETACCWDNEAIEVNGVELGKSNSGNSEIGRLLIGIGRMK